MTNNGIVTIHGKEYMTVARRLELANTDKALESLETEVLSHNPVVVRAKLFIKGKTFTGISSVNTDSQKFIERQNPYEVAETSAVGRALGFAGYGLIESVASADEVARAVSQPALPDVEIPETLACAKCGEKAIEKEGVSKTGKQYHGIFCTTGERSHTMWLTN